MNPLLMQKKDLAMNMTTNVYMNTTTKYVPTPLTLNKPAGSTQKLKEQSFVYQKSPRSNKEKDDAPMKQSFSSNPRSSGIQGTKISDLGSSSLFKGLDGLYNKPIQYTDRRKQQKSQQKQQNDNNRDKDKSGSTYFERKQNNKLADSSVTYGNNNNQPNQTGTVSSRLKGPTNDTARNVNPKVQADNSQMLIRKPQNRPVTTQEKPKQVQKPQTQTISRKPQLTNDKTPKQESFTTQTSSYVYMPPNRRGSISSEQPGSFKSPDINKTPMQTKKEQPVKKVQTRPKLPENIFARDRSRQSKEINLNLEINTDVTYFKIETRGASSRRSSTENPASRQTSTRNSPQKNSVNTAKKAQQPAKPNPYQKLIQQKQVQVPKPGTTQNSIYQKPNDLIKKTQQPSKIETQKTDPQSSVDEKKFVYRPKPAQIQTKQIVKPNQPSTKNQQKVSVDKETSNKPINSSYQYGKKSKEDLIRENQKTELEKPEITSKKPAYVYPGMKKTEDQQKKIESPRNSNLIDSKSPYQNQGITKVQNSPQQNNNIENSKPYPYLNRQNITKPNPVQEQGKVQQKNILNQALKPLQTQQIYKPSYRYTSKNEDSQVSQQMTNNLSQPQKTQSVARYPYAQKPIQTSQRPLEAKRQTQISQKPQIQKIESPKNQNQPSTKTQQSSYPSVQKQQPIKTIQPIQRQNIQQRPVQKPISQNVVDRQNSPRNTEVSPKPSIQEAKVILPAKQNTSGYVYQPPNRRNQNGSTQVSTVIQKQKNSQKSIPSSQNVPALSSNKSIPIKNQTPVVSPRKTEQTAKPSQTIPQQIQRTVQNKTQPQNQQSIESPKQPNQNQNQRKQQVQSPKRQEIKRQQTNSTTNDSRAKPIQNTLTNRPPYNRYQNKVQEPIVVTPQQEQPKVQNNRFKRATTVANNPIQTVPEVKTKVQSPRINSVSAINKTQTIKPKATVTQEIPSNQTEIKKKPIPKSAYSLLNILINKKIKSNMKFSVQKLKNSKQVSLKRQRNLNILAKKYVSLFQNYERFLKFEAFYALKKVFVSVLTNTVSSTAQNVSGSRVVGLKPLQKSKQLKEDAEYETLKTNMRKVLCLKLNSLFNNKIRSVLNENLIPRYSNNTLSTKKKPIFVALHQLFVKKTNQNLNNSFKRIKFTYHFVSKRNQDDILPLYETKSKKMSKQEIAKFFQNLFPSQAIVPSGSRVSLIQKTPEKKQASLAQSRIPSVKSIQSPTLKAETQKIQTLRSRIETIEKDIHNQQKLASDKQRQLNAKKMQLRKQINAIKKQHETRKKQNQELVDKLKQYENISNFATENKQSSNILDEAMRQQQHLNEQYRGQFEINYGNNQYLRSLCDLYADHVFKNLSSPELLPHSIDDFLSQYTQISPLLAEGLNYVLEPFSDGNIKFDEVALANFEKSRNTIQERLMLEKNLLLKSQISRIEAQFIGESHQTTDSTVCRIQEQVNVFRSLAKNYIKQRYLWQWIRKSIEQN